MTPSQERLARSSLWLVSGSVGTIVGLVFCTAGETSVGGWGVVISMLAMLRGLHRLGRSGADP